MNPAEHKIRTSLMKAAQYHREDGLSPNEAIIKAASEDRLNPPMVERVIEGFNQAKTNAVLSKAEDKTASFPIAERDAILDGIFGQGLGAKPGEQKVASAEVQDSFVEIPMSSGSLSFLQKTAGVDTPSHDVPKLIRDGISGLMELEGDVSKFAQEVLMTESDMARAMRSIGEYFELSDNKGKFAAFEADILSERGAEAKPTLDVIHRHFCPWEGRCDDMPKLGTRAYQATDAHDQFESLMDLTDSFIRQEQQLANMQADFRQKKAEFDTSIREVSGIFPPPPPGAADFFASGDESPRPLRKAGGQIADGSAASFISTPFAGVPKTASDAGSTLKDLSSFGIEVSPAMAAQKGVSGAITKSVGDNFDRARALEYEIPRAEAKNELENIRRMTIIRDLMANDDIISKHKPQDVERVYNTMLAIAPNVTLYPGVVQSVLRTSLERQAVDPFTAKQFADLEGVSIKNRQELKK